MGEGKGGGNKVKEGKVGRPKDRDLIVSSGLCTHARACAYVPMPHVPAHM